MRAQGLFALIILAGCTNTAQTRRHVPREPLDVWETAAAVARERPRWTEIEACPTRGVLVYPS